MISCKRTNAADADFKLLVRELDKELAVIDGNEHAFYNQYNTIDDIKHTVVAYDDQQPIGCGAIKAYTPGIMEVKRMYVPVNRRGEGIASKVLVVLETWAKELGCHTCVLETGKRQPDAIRLYTKNGYQLVPNYGQYIGIKNSVCFEKKL